MSVMAYMPYGAGGIIIRVEADVRRGIPGIDITGLAEGAVREARQRVRAAFRNSGFSFPADRVLINLAPAGLRKGGTALDLPIALSVMAAADLAPVPGNVLVMGELELSGRIRPARGVLAAIGAGLAEGVAGFIVPAENAAEAAILARDKRGAGARFMAAESLREAVRALYIMEENGKLPALVPRAAAKGATDRTDVGDFADVKGQAMYKRALEIAAAGGHNALVFGPPGAGKTMLARRMPSIMASLAPDEAVEVTRLYSLAGPFRASAEGPFPNGGLGGCGGFIDRLITRPPFRAPHHSASAEGILGGGRFSRPGEITLAHFGVLFLDEAPQFRVNVLQALREPLEDGAITIARAEGPTRLPADFQLLMAANACPCGRLGAQSGPPDSGGQPCFCSPEEILRYWRKFGGALLDRVEIRAAVLPPKISEIGRRSNSAHGGEERSAVIAQRVQAAVEIQRQRFQKTGIRRNARLPAGIIDSLCPMSARAESAFHKALAQLGLSGRAYHGVLRVARTIADLESSEIIDIEHILEAVQHRRFGEDPWDIFNQGI